LVLATEEQGEHNGAQANENGRVLFHGIIICGVIALPFADSEVNKFPSCMAKNTNDDVQEKVVYLLIPTWRLCITSSLSTVLVTFAPCCAEFSALFLFTQ
jgi:hypothetical protein